ncbi:MAG: hypothetical protein V1915_00005, partial [Candidatus Bathyarchaeota archaeon]
FRVIEPQVSTKAASLSVDVSSLTNIGSATTPVLLTGIKYEAAPLRNAAKPLTEDPMGPLRA